MADGARKALVVVMIAALLRRDPLLASGGPEGSPEILALVSPAGEVIDGAAAGKDCLGLDVGAGRDVAAGSSL